MGMKFLYGTSNPSKLEHMEKMLEGLNVKLLCLKDLGIELDVEECGNSPLENARIKAIAYYKVSGIPTFSCDSGLYIEGLEDAEQPGVKVRRVKGRYLNDEEYIEYYSSLALRLGGTARAKFKNAICLVVDEDNIFEYDGEDIADHFLMTSKAHSIRKQGFPMDSIALDIKTGEYFLNLNDEHDNESDITDGFRNFFQRAILK